jgi:hypothetical protein
MTFAKPIWAAFIVALCVSFAPQARAQADTPFAFDQLDTTVVGISPPAGWRTAYFSVQGPLAELGELTTEGVDVTRWRDLLAYLTVVNITGHDVSDMNANLAETAGHCSISAQSLHRPAAATSAEQWGQIVCLDRPGQQNAVAEAPLQIYLFRSQRAGASSFRFWRAWRGAPGDVQAMLQRAGISGAPVLPTNPSQADLANLPMPALTEIWAREISQAFELCDLAAGPCASLNRSAQQASFYEPFIRLAPLDRTAALMTIRGDRTDMQTAANMYRRLFNRDPPSSDGIGVATTVAPRNHNFRSSGSFAALTMHMYVANKGVGGIVGVSGDAPFATPAEGARYRAYLLRAARLAASVPGGPAYDAFSFDMWPND